MLLKYHHQIFALLDQAPSVSSEAIVAIAAREQTCGVVFPASIKEWYCLQEANRLFEQKTGHHLEDLDELGRPEETRQGFLRVATEAQAVVGWYVRLNAGNDPPVWHNNDQWDESDLRNVDWQPESACFTNFVFDLISARHFDGYASGFYLVATGVEPADDILQRLKDQFHEGPYTPAPGRRVRRFFNTHGILTIQSLSPEQGEDSTAQWTIDCDSPESLYEFSRAVWNCPGIADSIRPQSHSKEADRRALEIIQRLRDESPVRVAMAAESNKRPWWKIRKGTK